MQLRRQRTSTIPTRFYQPFLVLFSVDDPGITLQPDELAEELRKWVAHEIGSFAKPEQIRFTDALPKTRSGKIMRRLLREIVTSNTVVGDVTTLEDLSVVTKLAAQHDEE